VTGTLLRSALACSLALVLSLYCTPLMRQAAIRFGIVDRPDGRLKNQKEPVPYLGGIAIYLSFLLALTATLRFDSTEVLGLLLAGAIVVILGLVDDFGVLSPGAKLAGQVVAVNQGLDADPASVNRAPYDDGWLIRLKADDPAALDGLLTAAAYRAQLGA